MPASLSGCQFDPIDVATYYERRRTVA